MFNIGQEDNVLIIHNINEPDQITKFRKEIQNVTNGSVDLQNSEVFISTTQPFSKYDVVVSNPVPPHTVEHSDELLALIIKVLKPNGKLIVKGKKDLTMALKLNGFINIQKTDEDTITTQKPAFEVGSKSILNLSNKAKQWTIDNNDEDPWLSKDDGELIEQDLLIDKDDLTKPDKESLRVCSTTGKRKACADCTCGLAEELKGEQKETPKSSCGSQALSKRRINWQDPLFSRTNRNEDVDECYLGDAFRCATCPYLGMPAFKPGDTVKLDLSSDI